MANIILLHDINEKDLARDFKDLLEEFNLGPITMIPLSSNRGFTLEEKERHYFDSADGAIFLLTPGAEKLGQKQIYPSPSVTHEMGQATQKFKDKPESFIYFVDKKCNLPAIDQKAYIDFSREDIRSVISSITQLIKELKSAGLFRTTPIPTQLKQEQKIDVPSLAKSLGDLKISVLFDLSNKPNGGIPNSDLNVLLKQKYGLSTQDINFLKRDLLSFQVVLQQITTEPTYSHLWWLTNPGWEIVRLEIKKKKEAERVSLATLMNLFGQFKK